MLSHVRQATRRPAPPTPPPRVPDRGSGCSSFRRTPSRNPRRSAARRGDVPHPDRLAPTRFRALGSPSDIAVWTCDASNGSRSTTTDSSIAERRNASGSLGRRGTGCSIVNSSNPSVATSPRMLGSPPTTPSSGSSPAVWATGDDAVASTSDGGAPVGRRATGARPDRRDRPVVQPPRDDPRGDRPPTHATLAELRPVYRQQIPSGRDRHADRCATWERWTTSPCTRPSSRSWSRAWCRPARVRCWRSIGMRSEGGTGRSRSVPRLDRWRLHREGARIRRSSR